MIPEHPGPAKGNRYMKSGNRPNALIHEKSPYLLQHAHNPVQWLPWSETALKLAQAEDKPLFVSIGYSTCHWCHVMERESFESADVADVLNHAFICVKVDREERPDVDRTFMQAVQAMGIQGGWPLSVWLTHDLRPFYGGTYFPPTARFGRPGFRDLLIRIHELWTTSRESVTDQAGRVALALEQGLRESDGSIPGEDALHRGFASFRSIFDPEYGGFGHAPKFPRPSVLNYLLRYHRRFEDTDALSMVVHTLRRMTAGGIHDHVGGGFARYSVDREWRVPHFEKMLNDQAQLMTAFSEAYQITGAPDLAEAVRDIAWYVADRLTSPEGAFFCAEDADSEGEEGAFYAWSLNELEEILGEKAVRVVALTYGCTPEGNFERGLNVLSFAQPVSRTAEQTGLSEAEVKKILRESAIRLFREREKRERPHRDDKVLASWNGLMIHGLATAFQAMGDDSLLAASTRAADFVLDTLWKPEEGLLLRRFRDGEAGIDGFLDDYAFLALGLLSLYEACLNARYLIAGLAVAEAMIHRFEAPGGGFYFNVEQAGIPRHREDYDGADPSGASIAALVCLRLAEFTGDAVWRNRAEDAFRTAGGILATNPEALPAMLCALDLFLSNPRQVVITGDLSNDQTRALVRAVQSRFSPETTAMHADGETALIAPWLAAMPHNFTPAAYVCRNFVCELPVTDPEALTS